MRTIYANITPLTNAYTTYYRLFSLKELKPRKVYICIWDLYFYEDKRFLPSDASKKELLAEYVQNIEKLLHYLELDYSLIYLSEARKRFYARPDLTKLFQKNIATITLNDLQLKANVKHALFGETTLSRMNYMIIDYLVATHLHELFPELAQSKPTTYVSSPRFRVLYEHILTVFSQNYRQTKGPEVEWMSKTPIVLNKEGRIPGFDMTEFKVREITEEFFEHNSITEKFLDDSIHMFESVEIQIPTDWKTQVHTKGAAPFLLLLNKYLEILRSIIHMGKPVTSPVSLFINDPQEFEDRVKPLNAMKLKILALCNGKRTSYELAKELKLNPVTVSVYFGRLRELGLISNDHKPILLVRNIVVDLSAIS